MIENLSVKDSSTPNPLLEESGLDYDAINFPLIKTEHFIPAIQKIVSEVKEEIFSLDKKYLDNKDFLSAWDSAFIRLERIVGIYFNLFSAHADEEFQKLARVISPILAQFSNDIYLNEFLFSRIKRIYLECSRLDSESCRFAEKIYSEFIRNGANLNSPDKEELRKIDNQMATLSPKFSENLLAATMAFHLHLDKSDDLDGLPDDVIERARLNAEEKKLPGWVFTLQAPSYRPFMSYSRRRDLREKLYSAYASRSVLGKHSNQEIIRQLIKLRKERAQLLNCGSHAEYVLQERMAKSPKTVTDFLDSLHKFAWEVAQSELKDLQKIASNFGINKIQPWDILYLMEIAKEETLSFNDEALKPYFELNNVQDGLFKVASKLYGLKFLEVDVPTYHSDVQVFKVEDENAFVGLLYVDLFARDTKKSGAWMTLYQEQYREKRPHVSICCNFAKPSENQPTLLTLDEVRTIFHEFGHALHGLFSETTYKSLSGTNVYWDFVELPSQIMENWVNEKEALEIFARHYKTGETIPEDWIQKIKEESKFMSGYATIRQLNFAYLDMAYHSLSKPLEGSLEDFEKDATKKTTLLPTAEKSMLSTSFDHIFGGGYSAGYYSYKWAEVLEADAFEAFQEKGIFDQSTAEAFRKNILSKGNSEDPMKLYVAFRGKEPKIDALLKREGLLKTS